MSTDTYANDFNAVKALGRQTGSTRTEDQTALAPFWEGNASVHWNQAANQIARANAAVAVGLQPAARGAEHCDGRHGVHDLERQAVLRVAMPAEVTWRPVTSIPLADTDGNPDTDPDPDWQPLVTTPSHPEYPAGHPSLNGAAATVLLATFDDDADVHADDARPAEPHLHQHRAGALRREQRTGLGRHALPEHGRHQRRRGRGDRQLRQ